MSGTVKFVALLCLVCCLATSVAGTFHWTPFDGNVFQNGFVHQFDMSSPQDANRIMMKVSGSGVMGEVTFKIDGPATLCPNGQPSSCGRNVANISFVVSSRLNTLSLKKNSLKIFQANGIPSDFEVTGSWIRESFHMIVSYTVHLTMPGNRKITVPIESIYAGQIDLRTKRFVGQQYGFVVPYDDGQYNGTQPYQFLITYGNIDSSLVSSTLAGYRVISPISYASTPGYPATINAVSGTVRGASFASGISCDAGLLRGNISLHTPTGLVNITNAVFQSDYEVLRNGNYLRINGGYAHDSVTGKDWYLHNLKLKIKD